MSEQIDWEDWDSVYEGVLAAWKAEDVDFFRTFKFEGNSFYGWLQENIDVAHDTFGIMCDNPFVCALYCSKYKLAEAFEDYLYEDEEATEKMYEFLFNKYHEKDMEWLSENVYYWKNHPYFWSRWEQVKNS